MPDLTPTYVMQIERRMRIISEKEYVRRLSKLWAPKILRVTPVEGRAEIINFMLSTATIEPIGPSGVGGMAYENMMVQPVYIAPMTHGKGIEVERDQLEDLNGTGVQTLAEWSEQTSVETACYPERLTIQMILNGGDPGANGSANAYDGVPFFAKQSTGTPHPFNPFAPSRGGFYNWHTGGGSYGALPIDESVTMDTAIQNLGIAMSRVASIKMPNGINGRKLTPAFILAPKRMAPRVTQLMDAKYIAMAASSGGAGSANVEGIIKSFGLAEPIFSEEIGAAFSYDAQIPVVNPTTGAISTQQVSLTGSDTDWFLICAEAQTSQLGGLIHCLRRPFETRYFTGMGGGDGYLMAYLARARKLEYQCDGRQSVQYGHPYTFHKFSQT